MKKTIFEHMKPGEEGKVSALVWEVFAEFEAPEYKQEGIDEFKRYILPEELKANSDDGTLCVICCKHKSKLIGVIATRAHRHISLLFVKKEFHRQGIARKLLAKAIKDCCRANINLCHITVNSSPYAVSIYEKLGFEQTDVEQEANGIRFTPMKLSILKWNSVPE